MKTTQTSPDIAGRLADALKGVIRVADRKTDEFDEARAALALYDAQASQEAAGDDPFREREVWRCSSCGDSLSDTFGPRWRWTGTHWQHSHGVYGHFDAESFGLSSPTPEPDRLQAPAMVGEVVAWKLVGSDLVNESNPFTDMRALADVWRKRGRKVLDLYTHPIALRPVSEADAEAVVKTVSLFDHPKVRVTNALRALQSRFESVQEKAP